MKNEYKIEEGIVTIYINRRNGDIVETTVDKDDFDLVNSVEGKWCVAYNKYNKVDGVICFARTSKGKKIGKDIKIHRLIMDFPSGLVVDHKDRNPLNNRRSNLRVVTSEQNSQNRSPNRNTRSGVRGLSYSDITKKWTARVQINKKRVTIGHFETIEKGELALKEYRKNNMKYSIEGV